MEEESKRNQVDPPPSLSSSSSTQALSSQQPSVQQMIPQQIQGQECQKKKESKWSEILAEQESVQDYIIDNLQSWETFPISMKIQVLEQFYVMMESSNLEEDDIILRSKCTFLDQLKHNNPKIVQITLKILVLYTQRAQSINYNVPNVISQLISKVMIRKEFREQTIKLFMLIFSKCRDGLNFGIQEIFCQTSPKPICETLYLFEFILINKEQGMKEFFKQYLPQIYDYTQNQYQEVRSQALKLFVSLIKEYGEPFVTPYKQKLKSNQIDYVNKQLQKEVVLSKLQVLTSLVQKKTLSNHSSQSNLSKTQSSLPSNNPHSTNEKPVIAGLLVKSSKVSKPSVNNPNRNSSGSVAKKREPVVQKHSKDDMVSSFNDLSKSRSSINSMKIQKKKHSDTMSSVMDQEDSSDKNSEISLKNYKDHSDSIQPLSQLKKIVDKVTKADLTEILEQGVTDLKKKRSNKSLLINLEVKNREKKASSVYKKDKSTTSSISSFKKGGEVGIFSSKPPLSQSSSQSSLVSKKFKSKSEQELTLKKSPLVVKMQKQKITECKYVTPNGVDDDSYYANPVLNKESSKESFKENDGFFDPVHEANTLQYSNSQIQDLDLTHKNSKLEDIHFKDNLLLLNISKMKEQEEDENDFKDKFASNDSSIQMLQEGTPFGVDPSSFYGIPNPNYHSDEEDNHNEKSHEKNQHHPIVDNILEEINDQHDKSIHNQKEITDKAHNNNLQVQENNYVTPNGVDNQSNYAEPKQSYKGMDDDEDDDNEEKVNNQNQEETPETNEEGDDVAQQKQQQQNKEASEQDNNQDKYAKKRSESQKQKSRTSIHSNISTPNEDIQRQKKENEAQKKQEESQQHQKNNNNNGEEEIFQSLVLRKDGSNQLQNQLIYDKFYNNLLHVVEEEPPKQNCQSIRRQLSDISLQMSFIHKQNHDSNDFFANGESNGLSQISDILKISNKKESHFASEPYLNDEEEKQNQSSNFSHFQSELSHHQQSQQNSNNNPYAIRGYFFNQDIKDILSVVESAEHKQYFFKQNQNQQINNQQPYTAQISPNTNINQKPKELFLDTKVMKKKSSVHQQRSNQPSQSPHKQQVSQSLQRNSLQNKEERENAKQTINKFQQMNETVLKSYMFLFNNKLVSKLFQQQKDKIIYLVNRDNVNQWFNQRDYDNVSIISFFILFIGDKFEREDVSYLSKFWNFQKFLSFNNALIQSQTIHVMHTYFKIIQKYNFIKINIKPKVLRDTINKLIKIIPVSRDKLFDESFAFLDFLFELDSYNNYIFDAISEVLQSNVPKQTVSSLRILSNFLRLYGEKRLNSLKPFMHIIKSISFSANLQVRNAAIEFYQEAYSWMGDSIFEYTKSLKKSQLLQLEKAFAQVSLKEKRPLKCPIDVFGPIMNDSLFEKQQNIFTSDVDEEIQKQESYIRKALAVQEWVNKDDLLEKIVEDASKQMKLKESHYSNLIKILLELLGDWNKYLIENTLILIRSLALKLKKDFSEGGMELFEAVFELYSEQKSINRDKVSKALVSLFIVTGLQKLQKIINKLLGKKRNIKELLNVLNFGLRKSDVGCILSIIQEIQMYLSDKDSNTKIAAFDLFGVIRYLYGNPIIEQNLTQENKSNRFIMQKIQECHVKCAKMKCLSMQKKKLEVLKISNSNSYSTNSEMSTASYDKQYFYVQIQNCSFSNKKSQVPIQQFKLQKKQELMQKIIFEEQPGMTEIFQGSFIHEFEQDPYQKPHQEQQQQEDIDEI